MPNGKNPEYSIVIPAHNEEGNILPFVTRIIKMATTNRLSYEVIAVDDVSSDSTGKLLDKLSDKFPQIKVIHRFSKTDPAMPKEPDSQLPKENGLLLWTAIFPTGRKKSLTLSLLPTKGLTW